MDPSHRTLECCSQSAGSVETTMPPRPLQHRPPAPTAHRPPASTAACSTMCASARSTQTIRVPSAAIGNTWHQTAPQHQPAASATWKTTSTCSARCRDASTACHEPTSMSIASMAQQLRQSATSALGPTAIEACPSALRFRCNQPGHCSWDCLQPVICANYGELGHYRKYCMARDDSWACYECGQRGHVKWDCPRRQGSASELEEAPWAPVASAPLPSSSSSSTLLSAAATAAIATVATFIGRRPAEDDEPDRRVRARFGASEYR